MWTIYTHFGHTVNNWFQEVPIVNIAWEPQPWQAAFIACPVMEIFGGGSRGGGKSDAILGDWLNHADEYKANAIGLMVRRTRTELLEMHERARVIYGKIGARFTYQPMRVVMPNGARLTFAYLDRDSDAESYQGASFSRVYIEEVGNFPSPTPVLKLMATLRSGAGVPVGMRLTGNPGGPGHFWVKSRYIDPAPRGWQVIHDSDTGLDRIYLPSRVTNNKYLGPDYVQRLKAVGTPELVRAWLEGDWSVVAGAFFSEFSLDRHVIAPRALPEHWARFRSFDWGSARPFAVHWWAVSDGILPDIARGCLVCYREWYGMKPGEPNVGLHMTAEQVAEGIRDRERDDPKPKDGGMVGVADPSIFAEDGGPSIAARMTRAARIVFRPGDNKRVPQRGAMGGWDQVRARLVGDPDGRPMVVLFSTCRDLIRTLPAMQHDDARPEDIDCWVAGTMISTPDGPRAIETIEPCDVVDTPLGPRPVLRSYLSGTTETIRVALSDGRVLEGTPHHKIMIHGIGLVALSDLECHMTPHGRIIWSRSLNTAVSCINATRGGFITIRTALISAMALGQACIVRSGLMPVAKFLPVGISTIETMTTTTTSFLTSNACRAGITPDSISRSAWLAILVNNSRSGAARMPDALRFATMRARWSSTRLNGNSRALIVRLLLLQDIPTRNIAQMSVPNSITGLWNWCARSARRLFGQNGTPRSKRRPVHISAVGRSAERMQVYNLTVADAHLFYANGVLSSNTDSEDHAVDSCRYAMMSRPYVRDMEKPKPRDSWDAAFNRDAETLRDWRVT